MGNPNNIEFEIQGFLKEKHRFHHERQHRTYGKMIRMIKQNMKRLASGQVKNFMNK